ncbi:MAG: superoxide dismutase [Alphaproteobacteria bacterium]
MADAFTLPDLPYAEDALAPVIGAQTVGLHHGKHHKTYFDKMNPIVDGTEYAEMSLEDVMVSAYKKSEQALVNNAGQAWNHILYWNQFTPGGANAPVGKLSQAIDEAFGGFDAMKEQMVLTGAGVFGSGWAWLSSDNGTLSLMGTPGGENPLMHGKSALIGIDVWEHAYYLDYQNRRPDHIKDVLDKLINWSWVSEQFEG